MYKYRLTFYNSTFIDIELSAPFIMGRDALEQMVTWMAIEGINIMKTSRQIIRWGEVLHVEEMETGKIVENYR